MTDIRERTRATAAESSSAGAVDMKFEIVVIPVSDVDRAKKFYARSRLAARRRFCVR